MSDESEHQWYLRGYYEGEEAGRKAERERAAKVTDDHFISTDTAGNYRYCCDLSSVIRGAFPSPPLAEPATPPATAEHETHLSPDQLVGALTDSAHTEPGKLLHSEPFTKPEPARPLTLEARARAIMPNAVPSDLMTEHWTNTFTREVSNLCRDFAREALRAAIGCGVRLGEPDENGEQPVFHEATIILSRVDGRTDREACDEHVNEIVSAAIHAAEKGEVPR